MEAKDLLAKPLAERDDLFKGSAKGPIPDLSSAPLDPRLSAGGDQATNPDTGNWLGLFPLEDSPQVPGDPARAHRIGSIGRAGSLFATPTIHFDHSSGGTAPHVRWDAHPPSVIIPSRAVDARNVGRYLAYPASPTTRATSWRSPARFWHSRTWRRTALRRPALFTLDTHIRLSGRHACVLGSLACLGLMMPSDPNRFSSSAGTRAHRDLAIAEAPEVGIRTVAVSQPSSLEGARSPRDHAGSRVLAASSPRLRVAHSTGTVVRPPRARSSASVKSKVRATAPAGVEFSTGTLVVTSAPGGAAVFMNQRYVGKTPLETSVKAGSYAVLLELEGARWTDVVLVRADRVTRVAPQLQALSKPRRADGASEAQYPEDRDWKGDEFNAARGVLTHRLTPIALRSLGSLYVTR